MSQQMKFCPFCGKKLSIDAPFCPYCGKKLLESDDLPKPATYNKLQKEAPNVQQTADSSNKQKTYVALLLAIVVAGVLFMIFNNNKTNTVTSNSSFSSSIRKQEQDNIIAKNRRPDLKFLIEKNAFKNESDINRRIIVPTEKIAKDAAKLATGKEQRLYCSLYYATYKQPDKEYDIGIFYDFPDTVTYPQEDLMDYWSMYISISCINDKAKAFYTLPIIEHKQLNKKTDEYRTLEKMGFTYINDKPTLVKPGEERSVTFEEEEKKFRKRAVPWQKDGNIRQREFYKSF